ITARIDLQPFTKCDRRIQSPRQPCAVSHLAELDDADRDLRPIAVERASEMTPAGALHLDDLAAARAVVDHVRAIDPRMPGAQPFLTTRRDDDGRHTMLGT